MGFTMRLIIALLILILGGLQFQLWGSDHGVRGVWRMSKVTAEQRNENGALTERNEALRAEVLDLKHGSDAVEERARSDIGMVKPGETLFQVVRARDESGQDSQ